MMSYTMLKHAHMGFAYLLLLSFIARSLCLFIKPAYLTIRWVRIVPHITDTLILLSGLTLMETAGWPFFQSPWLMAKIVAVLAYIGLGHIALKRCNTLRSKGIFVSLSLALIFYILLVAKTKMVWPFF